MSDIDPRPIPAQTHHRRQAIYTEMGKLSDAVGQPCVVITIDAASQESHLVLHVPGSEDLADLLLLAQKAQYALAMQILALERQQRAQQPAQKAAQS